ncbi:hypothetical protein DSO57_1030878 [Entomophthora muscae]|uniref:Uncharacterized protein n=1 Tax=Entomophthora muscae TaxID=34485 RepID=A0ACC2SQG8_9FUNG|nr:hypothetical protein DSO57_1030878 [Entomophthora muscae]
MPKSVTIKKPAAKRRIPTKPKVVELEAVHTNGSQALNHSPGEALHAARCIVHITSFSPYEVPIEKIKGFVKRKFTVMVDSFESVYLARRKAISQFQKFSIEGYTVEGEDLIDESCFSNFFTEELGEIDDDYRFGYIFGKNAQVFMTYVDKNEGNNQVGASATANHAVESAKLIDQSYAYQAISHSCQTNKAAVSHVLVPDSAQPLNNEDSVNTVKFNESSLELIKEGLVVESDISNINFTAPETSLMKHYELSDFSKYKDELHDENKFVSPIQATESSHHRESNALRTYSPVDTENEVSSRGSAFLISNEVSKEPELRIHTSNVLSQESTRSAKAEKYSDSSSFSVWDGLDSDDAENQPKSDSPVLSSSEEEEAVEQKKASSPVDTHSQQLADYSIVNSFSEPSIQSSPQSDSLNEPSSEILVDHKPSDETNSILTQYPSLQNTDSKSSPKKSHEVTASSEQTSEDEAPSRKPLNTPGIQDIPVIMLEPETMKDSLNTSLQRSEVLVSNESLQESSSQESSSESEPEITNQHLTQLAPIMLVSGTESASESSTVESQSADVVESESSEEDSSDSESDNPNSLPTPAAQRNLEIESDENSSDSELVVLEPDQDLQPASSPGHSPILQSDPQPSTIPHESSVYPNVSIIKAISPRSLSPELKSQRDIAPPTIQAARPNIKRSIKDEPIECPVPLGRIHPSYYKSIQALPSKDKRFAEEMAKRFKPSSSQIPMLSQTSLVLTSQLDMASPSASSSAGSDDSDSSSEASSSEDSDSSSDKKPTNKTKSMLMDFLGKRP